MDDEEVAGAVEGDDLALELVPEGGLGGDHHADRELLAADLHGWGEGEVELRQRADRSCVCVGASEFGRFCGAMRV
jgi:hypothetical protein